jgi:hypothetical protein
VPPEKAKVVATAYFTKPPTVSNPQFKVAHRRSKMFLANRVVSRVPLSGLYLSNCLAGVCVSPQKIFHRQSFIGKAQLLNRIRRRAAARFIGGVEQHQRA